ncbi:barstar family protein [Massilia sp. PAMC28688]|uniref:barstar family protein n=1 Tax=Massilia sp. PAMC28688 TaxID=2861283 RepID=UPI001C636DFD|nr:barstar family protein [Massilia sp. PAMC28688]QYF95821.1 barstar family protein [Massilia sp. PAMC28688]
MIINIDGENMATEADFHQAIAGALAFSAHYGNNLDALSDVLGTDVERPLTLHWKNAAASQLAMGPSFDRIVGVLRRIEAQDAEWGLSERFHLHLD